LDHILLLHYSSPAGSAFSTL